MVSEGDKSDRALGVLSLERNAQRGQDGRQRFHRNAALSAFQPPHIGTPGYRFLGCVGSRFSSALNITCLAQVEASR